MRHTPMRAGDGAQLQGLVDYIQRKRTFKREKIQRMDLTGTKARTAANSRRTSLTLAFSGAPKPLLLPEPVLQAKKAPIEEATFAVDTKQLAGQAHSNSQLLILPLKLVQRQVSAVESSLERSQDLDCRIAPTDATRAQDGASSVLIERHIQSSNLELRQDSTMDRYRFHAKPTSPTDQ